MRLEGDLSRTILCTGSLLVCRMRAHKFHSKLWVTQAISFRDHPPTLAHYPISGHPGLRHGPRGMRMSHMDNTTSSVYLGGSDFVFARWFHKKHVLKYKITSMRATTKHFTTWKQTSNPQWLPKHFLP
jgi:hypothetical protein